MSVTALRSRMSKGLSKEPKTQPVVMKCEGKRKVQTLACALDKCREVLVEASHARTRRLVNNKSSIRPWTGVELEKLLKSRHVVHRSRERSDWSAEEVRHYCVRELLKEGFLKKMPWGEYQVAPKQLAIAS